MSDDVPSPDELHPDARIYEHEARDRDFEPSKGDIDLIDAVSGHVERHLGPVHSVFHEIVSDLVHVDLHWVLPQPERPMHTLVTSGMSERPMKTPEGCEEFAHMELLINLPPDWVMDQKRWDDERHYWPIRLLKSLARMPHEYDTWLFADHTVGHPEADPYGPGTEQCGALIAFNLSAPEEFGTLQHAGHDIHFFTVLPLYAEEIDYKLRNGIEALYERFEQAHVSDIVDPRRPNACAPEKKGLLGGIRSMFGAN